MVNIVWLKLMLHIIEGEYLCYNLQYDGFKILKKY